MRFLLGLVRTLVVLGLGLWIGGLFFFGAITAAVMFPKTREAGIPQLAPQMVGPMLTRFAWVCTAVSLVLIIGWWLDGALSKRTLWWRAQGALTLIAVSLGAYLNFGLLPTIERDQNAVLPLYLRSLQTNPAFTPQEAGLRARFDAGHESFDRLAHVNIWLLVGVLACFIARSLPEEPTRRQDDSAVKTRETAGSTT